MNEERIEDIVKSLRRIVVLLGDTVPTERIFAVAEILNAKIPDDENLVKAFERVIESETRFPPPAKFIEYAGASVRARAQDALEKIFTAVKRYGSGDQSGARRFLGEAAWRTLESCGGWTRFCLQQDLNIEVFRSQFINSFVDRVPALEASGELKREFLTYGQAQQAQVSANETKKLAESKDLNAAIKPSRSGQEEEDEKRVRNDGAAGTEAP